MRITISRYTPNLKNGKDIDFEIGEIVDYRTRNGEEYKITIDSKRMAKKAEGKIFYGYEAIFHDDKQRYFAVEDGIYNWKGKV